MTARARQPCSRVDRPVPHGYHHAAFLHGLRGASHGRHAWHGPAGVAGPETCHVSGRTVLQSGTHRVP